MSDFGVVEIDDACTILSDLIDAGCLDYAEPAAGQLGAATHAESGGRVHVPRSDDRLVAPSDLVAWLRHKVGVPTRIPRPERAPRIDPDRLLSVVDHPDAGSIIAVDRGVSVVVDLASARLLLPLIGWRPDAADDDEALVFLTPHGRVRFGFLPDEECRPRGIGEWAAAQILRQINL
jgi:hypothetical protein